MIRRKKIDLTQYKQCNKCRVFKPRERRYFYKRKTAPDGYRYTCIRCQRQLDEQRYIQQGEELRAQKRAAYWANPEKGRQRVREYHAKHPERHKQKAREWNRANLHRRRTNQRRYRSGPKGRAYEKRYDAENRDMRNIKEARRRARKRNLPDTFSHEDYQHMMVYWNHSCAVTGESENIQVDHWIPLNSPDCPGTVPGNLIPLCASLNAQKQDKDPEAWLIGTFGKEKGRAIMARVQAYFAALPIA